MNLDDWMEETSAEKGFDMKSVNAYPLKPADPRYDDASEVVEEIFSDNRRVGHDQKPYEF